MRFMAGGQLPLEPFVANKHLILNPTTTPRAADQARESPPARSSTPSAKSRWTNIRRDSTAGLLHSTPAVLFNRCSSHRRPRQSTVHPKARHFVPCKSKISGQETTIRSGGQIGIVRSQDYGGEDGTTGVGFRQRRPAVSAVHWMWELIVPHPGSGNPSGRKPVGPACEQLCFSSTS